MALIKFGQGTYQNYSALESKSQYEVFFCTDTHQIFVGPDEYTKGTKTLNAAPTTATSGDQDRLYAYNGSLYLCEGTDGGATIWERVANVSDATGSVTSIEVGEGLETASGSTSITSTGTIQHAVPSGASTVVDSLSDQTPGFGSTFAIEGVSTDKFGHVTGVNEHTVTLPSETAVTVTGYEGSASTVQSGGSITVITGVGMSTADGATNHDLATTAVTFTFPEVDVVTYEVSSEEDGVITLTGSNGSSSTAQIDGWNLLAKKSDISAVFHYKGQVTNVSDLPKAAEVGWVYNVINGSSQGTSSEYVCTEAGTGAEDPATWEELGTTIDLDAYATTAYVEEKLAWHIF